MENGWLKMLLRCVYTNLCLIVVNLRVPLWRIKCMQRAHGVFGTGNPEICKYSMCFRMILHLSLNLQQMLLTKSVHFRQRSSINCQLSCSDCLCNLFLPLQQSSASSGSCLVLPCPSFFETLTYTLYKQKKYFFPNSFLPLSQLAVCRRGK